MANTQALRGTAVFTRHNDLSEDFFEITVTLPTRVRVSTSNLNLAMDALGLAAKGDEKTAILSLSNGASHEIDALVTPVTIDQLAGFGY